MSLGNIISAGGSSADRIFETVTQAAHGFAVLDTIYNDGTSWVKAQSDNADTVAQGVVTAVTNVNEFEVTTQGVATVTGHGLTVGNYYWLSDTVAGGLQLTSANIAQSVLHVRDANTILVDIGQAIESSASTITTLDYGRLERISTSATSVLNNTVDFPFDTVASGNMVASGTVGLTATHDGRYLVEFFASPDNVAVDNGFGLYIDGVLHSYNEVNLLNTPNNLTMSWEADVLAGQVLTVRTRASEAGGYDFAGAGAVGAWAYMSVREQPTSTIVTANTTQYSTTEQATDRTWIDGKPIYERTFTWTGQSGSVVLDTLGSGYFDTVVSIDQTALVGGSTFYPVGSGSTDYFRVTVSKSTGVVQKGGAGISYPDGHVIIQYTKV